MNRKSEDKHIWTRFDREGSKAFEAFTIYRDMGPHRSFNKVLKELGGKPSYIRQIHRWARTHQWRYRVREYENHLDGIKLTFKRKELEQLHKEALSHSRVILERMIDMANGFIPASHASVTGIELYFKIIGLIHPKNIR